MSPVTGPLFRPRSVRGDYPPGADLQRHRMLSFGMTHRRSPDRGAGTAGFLLGFAIALAIAGMTLWILRGSAVRIDTSRPAVVHRIQQLQRLETVVYGMD